MKRKEEINKAAMKYLQKNTSNLAQIPPTILAAFKAGAKWADEHPKKTFKVMINQKEMDDIFITTLESIIQVCSLITSGNVAHYVPSIKGKCQSMIQFYKENPTSP